MTPIRKEIKRVIQETLRERGIDSTDQAFIINLFDSIMATLKIAPTLSVDEIGELREQIANNLLSNQHLLMMLHQQSTELETLRRLSLNLSSSLDLNAILRAVVSEAMHFLPNARTAHIFLYDEEKDRLEFGAAQDETGLLDHSFAEPRQDGLTYYVAREGKKVIVQDMQKHPLYKNSPASWTGSILGIPLKHEDTVVGVMSISRVNTGWFSNSSLRLLDLLAEQAASAISNARVHEKVRKQAKSDTLTGLPNRRALDEHLEEEIQSAHRTGHSFTTAMMDLDGFKEINDRYGHIIGDQVLRVFSNYLVQGLRTSDFIARYGGDEFTLVLSKSDLQASFLVTEKLLKKIKKFAFKLPNGNTITLGMSGGIALYPVHGHTASQLLRAADEALYRAKKHQRGTFVVAKPPTGKLQ